MKKTSIFGKWVLGLFTGLSAFCIGSTQTNAQTHSDLIISEYVEGSANNKAIEIYNGTGTDVDLAAYSLKKQQDGKNEYENELKLKGTLTNGNTYVLVHESASAELKEFADSENNSSVLSFNGNDAVALFKNGTKIDEVGVFGESSNWGKDVTLRRNPGKGPTPIYDASEWTEFTQDTFDGLGTHDAGSAPDPSAPTISLNPSSLNLSTTPNAAIEGLITVTGKNLTNDVTVAISGTNAAFFEAQETTLTASDIMSEVGKELVIIYTPTEAGNHTATLTLSSEDLTTPVTATLNGSCAYSNLAELYNVLYKNLNANTNVAISGDVVVTWKDSYNSRVWVQDIDHEDGGSMLLYLCPDFSSVNVGDVISNLSGELQNYHGLLELTPDAIDVTASGHEVYTQTVSLADLDVPNYQSALVKIENVSFSSTGIFEKTKYDYIISDGNNEIRFWATFTADYIDTEIPQGALDITGIISYNWNNVTITARNLNDIVLPCPVPTNLSADGITATSATINIQSEVGSYALRYAASEEALANAELVTFNETSKEITGLTPETQYFYQVKAICTPDTRESEWSAVQNFTTSAEAAPAMTVLSPVANAKIDTAIRFAISTQNFELGTDGHFMVSVRGKDKISENNESEMWFNLISSKTPDTAIIRLVDMEGDTLESGDIKATRIFTVDLKDVATPVFSAKADTFYTTPIKVEISCATENANLFYALNDAAYKTYSTAIDINTTTTVKAMAVKEGMDTAYAEITYNFMPTPEGDIVLQENFDGFTEGNINDQNSNVSTKMDDYTGMPGWSGANIYQAGGMVKLGASDKAGQIQLPNLDLSNDNGKFYVAFTAMAWSGDKQEIYLIANQDTVIVPYLVNSTPRSAENMREYVFAFDKGTSSTSIRFEAMRASSNRFFLDSIRIYQVLPQIPALMVQESVEMEAILGDTTEQSINVRGLYLTEDVKIACEGSNFYTDSASLNMASVMSANGADFKVFYKGAATVDSATLTLTSGELSETIKVYARAEETTEVANLAALYDYYENLDEEETFRVTGEIVVTHTDAFNTRIWAQDADMTDGASILIFRAEDYGFENIKAGDVIEGLTGTMSVYNNLLEFLPTRTMTASESGHALHVDTLSFAEIEANLLDNQSALICVKGVEFLADSTFATGKNYDLIQGKDTLVFRTDYYNADYIGQAIPSGEMTITGILTQYYENAQITARSFADFVLPAGYLAAPTFSPEAGVYTDSVEVSISCVSKDAEIFYAIDDAEFAAYEKAFWIKNSCSIRAFASLDGENSDTTDVNYTIRTIWAPTEDTLLYEPFDAFTAGDWGNASNVAQGSSDIADKLDGYTLMPGWTGEKVYAVVGTAKMGTGSGLGHINLPALAMDDEKEVFAVSFRAMAWKGDTTALRLVVNGDTTQVEDLDNSANDPDNLKPYFFTFENDADTARISFIGQKKNNGRFFLDDVRVYYMASEPTLIVSETVNMEAVVGDTTEQSINVRGLFLTEDVKIACEGSNFYTDSASLNMASVMSTKGADFKVFYKGVAAVDSTTLTLASGELSQTIKVYARAIERTEVANLAALYDYYENPDEEETFRVTGEIVVTHTDAFNTRIWAQDADMTDGASILIFRAEDYGFENIKAGDVIEGLTGTISVYNNLLEFLPTETLTVSESGRALHVDTLSFAEIEANLLAYQSALVCVEDVAFAAPDSVFATGTNYDLVQESDTLVFRTDYYNADYIGTAMPTGNLNITGILTQYFENAQITARNLADIVIVPTANEVRETIASRLYPNPTSGMFYLDIERDAQVDIFSANGALVESSELTAGLHEMNLDHKGIYFIRISNGKAVTVKRVIVL